MTFEDLRGRPSAEKWNALLSRLESLRVASGPGIRVSRSPQGQVVAAIRSYARPADRAVPFDLGGPVYDAEDETWYVTAGEGYLVERDVRNVEEGDCITLHEADNHRDEAGDLTRFEVAAGESLFLVVEVTKNGAVGITPEDPPLDPEPPAVTLAVLPSDTASTHYEPAIGEGSENQGAPGTYHYPLADFVAGEEPGSLKMVPRLAGQHISHWQELPTFENAGGETIWKEWDAALGVYKTKGFVGISPVTVTPFADRLEFSLGDGSNYNIGYRSLQITQDAEPPFVNFSVGTDIDKWVYVRGGVHILDRAEVDEPDDDFPPLAGEIYPRVIHLLPLSTAGTAGAGLESDEGGGWVEPEVPEPDP